jgi:hypothetical protein
VTDLDGFIENYPSKFQRGIDNSPCFAAFTGVGEFAGDPRASALPVMQQAAPEARVESPVPQLGQVYISLGQAF